MVGKCNNLLYCPVSFEPGWCRMLPSCPSEKGAELSLQRVLMALGAAVSGYLGASRTFLFYPLSPLSLWGYFLVLDSSALCAVSRVRFCCPYPGNVYVASGPGAICWACFSRCLLGSLSLCTFHLLCSFLHLRRGELLIPIGGFLCVAAEWVARLCRESVSGPPAPCKA